LHYDLTFLVAFGRPGGSGGRKSHDVDRLAGEAVYFAAEQARDDLAILSGWRGLSTSSDTGVDSDVSVSELKGERSCEEVGGGCGCGVGTVGKVTAAPAKLHRLTIAQPARPLPVHDQRGPHVDPAPRVDSSMSTSTSGVGTIPPATAWPPAAKPADHHAADAA
jgi:hypothetical protein